MPQISSFNNMVPVEYLAPAKVEDVLNFIENINEVEENVRNAIKAYRNIPSSVSNYEMPAEIEKFVDELLKLLPQNTLNKVENSDEFKEYKKAIGLWEDIWETTLMPIGLVTNELKKEIVFKDSHETSAQALNFVFNVGASARFNLQILSTEEATAIGLPTFAGDILLNQDIRAGVEAGAKISGGNEVITIGAGLTAKASAEFDAFYQVDAATPTYKALWNMYKKPLIPWSLTSMHRGLVEVTGNADSGFKAEGYRQMTIKTQGSLVMQGEVNVGKSISSTYDVGDKSLNFDVSIGGSLSRTQTLTGSVNIQVSKLKEGLLIESIINDSDKQVDNFSLAANATITGLDKIVGQYARIIIDRGDKVVKILEKYSRPGDLLSDKLQEVAEGDEALEALSQLLLGKADATSTIKKLITNDILEYFNKTPFSTEEDARELAKNVTNKLLNLFDIEFPESANTDEILKPTIDKLENIISMVQGEASARSNSFIEELQSVGSDALKPLEYFGEEVRNVLDDINADVEKSFNTIIEGYTKFKTKLEDALETSANIKIGLLLEKSRLESDEEKSQYNILIKDVENEDAKLLYRAIVLGDSQKAAKLLMAIPDSVVEIRNCSRRFETLRNSKTSLGINALDIKTSLIKDVSSELIFEVDNTGNLTVKQKYAASTLSNGISETRKAALNLTYGIANAASVPTSSGTFGIEYANQDKKLHSVKEMTDLLASLDLGSALFADEIEFNNGLPLPSLVNGERCKVALNRFKGYLAENKYTESKLSIMMNQTEDNFRALLNINGRDTFNFAMEYLTTLTNTTYRNERIDLMNILDCPRKELDSVEDNLDVFDYLDKNGDNKLKYRVVKSQLGKLDCYENNFGDIPDNQRDSLRYKYDWRSLTRKLQSYADTSDSIAYIRVPIDNINQAVSKFVADGDLSTARELNQKLKEYNKELTDSMDNWIKVVSPWTDKVREIFGKVGLASEGIDVRFLSLLTLLSQVLESNDELFLITITLKHKSDSEQTKRIVV